jgi:hypothetical protein
MMTIESSWTAIEEALAGSPALLASLRPPITPADLQQWSDAVGPLHESLVRMYQVHDGSAVTGSQGFSFIANWNSLPARQALARYEFFQPMFDLWGVQHLIPFAWEPSGRCLGVPPGEDKLFHIYDDTPPAPSPYDTIDNLMSLTVEALRGDNDEYRPELATDDLFWINLEEEADDLGH